LIAFAAQDAAGALAVGCPGRPHFFYAYLFGTSTKSPLGAGPLRHEEMPISVWKKFNTNIVNKQLYLFILLKKIFYYNLIPYCTAVRGQAQ
jgi:hypothetical protein